MNTSVDATRQALDRARHVPGFVYTSAEVFAREKERLFMRDCLCFHDRAPRMIPERPV